MSDVDGNYAIHVVANVVRVFGAIVAVRQRPARSIDQVIDR